MRQRQLWSKICFVHLCDVIMIKEVLTEVLIFKVILSPHVHGCGGKINGAKKNQLFSFLKTKVVQNDRKTRKTYRQTDRQIERQNDFSALIVIKTKVVQNVNRMSEG